MTLPDPEVRARPSVVGRGVPPRVPRGEDRPRVVVVVSSSPPASPPRVCEHARGPVFFAASRSPPPPPLVRGAAAVRLSRRCPLARCVVSRPAGSRSPDPARSGSGFVPLSPALRLAAARVGGPAAAPHPLSSARPRPPAWNRGVVSRRGASRGSASVSRRLGGSRRVASPGSGHPPPSSRSPLPLVRPRLAVRRSLPAAACRGGLRGSPRFPSVSLPARVGSSVLRVLRSLARSRASRPRSARARAPTWLILPVAYACLKD